MHYTTTCIRPTIIHIQRLKFTKGVKSRTIPHRRVNKKKKKEKHPKDGTNRVATKPTFY